MVNAFELTAKIAENKKEIIKIVILSTGAILIISEVVEKVFEKRRS